ncbi:MAG: hypothetical protein HZB26_06705 [Candidatus Hydrogenedentes bacterium]|nr:hypothetical protein [Candidatus Hydrogenedentota bacterium]
MITIMLSLLVAGAELPAGAEPSPVSCPHFPDAVHAFVWRNWPLVPVDRMAKVLGAAPADMVRMGQAMGLGDPPTITPDVQKRSYITAIRRNWHVLPYEQLLTLLDWTPEQLAYTLREDDFLYIKLGSLKPKCAPLKYSPPDEAALARERAIGKIVRDKLPKGLNGPHDPLFGFVQRLSAPMSEPSPVPPASGFSPRFCYSYFALYGDPLLEKDADPYPDAYLARMAASGVDGVWLQAVLYKLAPFPWDAKLSERYQERLENLKALVARARKHGISIYLYFNEPRAMPLPFFDKHPELKGTTEGDHAALCTSAPEVQAYLTDSVASICKAVPDLGGFFTITASENFTSCWSHEHGADCPRCSKRTAAEVIAEVNSLVQAGIRKAGAKTRLLAWDWGWQDKWAVAAVNALPAEASLMSGSEWGIPIDRGGVKSSIWEYSISAVGPGPRATAHWNAARARGLKTIAKIQAGNTWELSAVPYIPAVANVAQHAANLRDAHVDGLMLGWTLGGYPSPNLEVVAEIGKTSTPPATPDQAMLTVATRRFGAAHAGAVVTAWKQFSEAFKEFPFGGGLYTEPMQMGPANLLWEKPTGYSATMVGFPYDDLEQWRGQYPADVFAGQLAKIADGFEAALTALKAFAPPAGANPPPPAQASALQDEIRVAEASCLHFRSAANQVRFVAARNELTKAPSADTRAAELGKIESLLREELGNARRLLELQNADSRIGFEASNHYFYIPADLAEKVINCHDLLERWLPQAKEGKAQPAAK